MDRHLGAETFVGALGLVQKIEPRVTLDPGHDDGERQTILRRRIVRGDNPAIGGAKPLERLVSRQLCSDLRLTRIAELSLEYLERKVLAELIADLVRGGATALLGIRHVQSPGMFLYGEFFTEQIELVTWTWAESGHRTLDF